ncbi:MAG TPA: phosphoribosylformylglycinamidine synthase I [Anaerolineaceae bacterium]|nr:phosphoribosylformylglycinamidine synthase I [Anaerolineaceae bacterium]HPN53266.1 phosphoribosylformylglycinamidine synthase I [Anaerolineaceae bacterium]
MQPRALILHANGINRDLDVAQALELAGAQPEILHLNQLRAAATPWDQYQMLVIPGGFSYADALGGGRLFAIDLNAWFSDQLQAFIAAGKPVLGICNGFQVLVKAGVLPGRPELKTTLTFNENGHFECRWVEMLPRSQKCLWTRGLQNAITCPVAHGEGQFVFSDPAGADLLAEQDEIALIYAHRGQPANGRYPANPNGSIHDIAGVCNPAGNVLGLMPHPEDHIFQHQHPRWTRGEHTGSGLQLFINGVTFARQF